MVCLCIFMVMNACLHLVQRKVKPFGGGVFLWHQRTKSSRDLVSIHRRTLVLTIDRRCEWIKIINLMSLGGHRCPALWRGRVTLLLTLMENKCLEAEKLPNGGCTFTLLALQRAVYVNLGTINECAFALDVGCKGYTFSCYHIFPATL